MNILHIDSSITGANSVSRQIGARILARLKHHHPHAKITYHDLAAEPLPQLGGDVLAARAGGAAGSPGSHEFAAVEAALETFLAADIVVIGAPMYNFAIPSQLKAWIDCLAVAGRTFTYSESGVQGLAGGKRVIVASARGNIYSAAPMTAFDFQEAYLKGFFGFIGVTDLEFVRAEGVALSPDHRETALKAALELADAL